MKTKSIFSSWFFIKSSYHKINLYSNKTNMAKWKKRHTTWQNIKLNLARRLERAKKQWKSANYIKDLETALAKKK